MRNENKTQGLIYLVITERMYLLDTNKHYLIVRLYIFSWLAAT